MDDSPIPVHAEFRPVLDPLGGARTDHGGDAEVAGHDGAMGKHAALLHDQATGIDKKRGPPRVGRRATAPPVRTEKVARR